MNYSNIQSNVQRITPLNKWERYLWITATVLLAIDVATTWYVISRFGVVAESNPIMADVIANYGLTGLALSKVVIYLFGFAFREVVDSHRWVVPLGVIVPALPVAIMNLVAVGVVL